MKGKEGRGGKSASIHIAEGINSVEFLRFPLWLLSYFLKSAITFRQDLHPAFSKIMLKQTMW